MALFKKILTAIKDSFGPTVLHVKRNKGKSSRLKVKKPIPRRKITKLRKFKRPAPKPVIRKKIRPSKKPAKIKKPGAPKARFLPPKPAPKETAIRAGEITHYFSRISVCVIKITAGEIRLGDRLKITRPNSHFVQIVRSLQIENQDVALARKGQLIGLKMDKKAAPGDQVFKLV